MKYFFILALLIAAPYLAQSHKSSNDLFLGEEGHHGFIPLNSESDLFYWLFDSRTSPSEDPLILWLTGGPGCSSELALFFENGPFSVNKVTKNLQKNPYSWNGQVI